MPLNSLVPDLVTALILAPVKLPLETSYGLISTEICSNVSILIGFLTDGKPLALRPKGSFWATPSTVKLLYLLFVPDTEIDAFLASPSTIILESFLTYSEIDLSILGVPSISAAEIAKPEPNLVNDVLASYHNFIHWAPWKVDINIGRLRYI